MIRRALNIFLLLGTVLFFLTVSFAGEDPQEVPDMMNGAPRVFLDCWACDRDYIRTEITFVTYVRDRMDADVHVLVTTQGTGSGGREYTLNFMGLREYEGMNNLLTYNSNRTDTRDDVRRGLTHVLKAGLIPYVARTPILEHISFNYKRKTEPVDLEDKWDYWVFYASLRGQLSGQKSYDFAQLNGNISANRITPESKLRLGVSANFNERNFKIDGETISSPSDEQNYWSQWVKSIGEHWSVGGWMGGNSNTYNNLKFRVYLAPALEFNVFPYEESTRRQFRFMYRVGMSLNWYREETIFDRIKETLVSETLSVTWEQQEPWGYVMVQITDGK